MLQLERRPRLAPLFRRLPAVFWIYLLPMLATSAGLLPAASPLYPALTRYLLPASLALILLSSDLRAIARLGPRALGAMAAASAGVALGAVVALLLFRDALGPEAWKGLAALTGTWIGGSANLLAVSGALGLSPDAQGIAILVDTLVGYSWMGVLVALSSRQPRFDRWLGADRSELTAIGARLASRLERDRRPTSTRDAALLVGLALAVAALALASGSRLPPLGEVLTPRRVGHPAAHHHRPRAVADAARAARRRRRLEPRLRRLLSPARLGRSAGRPRQDRGAAALGGGGGDGDRGARALSRRRSSG